MADRFNGFSPLAPGFFERLAVNNNKTCLWITFKRYSPDWKQAPCFFFEITADSYRYGMGV